MSPIDAKLAAMQAEWRSVKNRARSEQVGRWDERRKRMEHEEARLRDEGRWMHGRDDFLGVLDRDRDELTHSRMVAWLLDPCARHGLGTRVLAGVLRFFGEEAPPDLTRARTRCEVPIGDGRADIVVDDARGLFLVIENKIDAEEREGQCDRYREHAPADARFILLSPKGRAAKTAKAFKALSYPQLAGILRRALEETAPSDNAGRRVAQQYLETLEREFS